MGALHSSVPGSVTVSRGTINWTLKLKLCQFFCDMRNRTILELMHVAQYVTARVIRLCARS